MHQIIRFMVRSLMSASFILCLFSGCYETYMGLETDLTGADKVGVDKVLVTDEYLPVSVALNDPSYRPSTRGQGAFDSTRPQSEIDSMWHNATFYLYAFRNDSIGSYTESVDSKQYACLLDNEEAYMDDLNSLVLSYRQKNKYGHPIYWSNENELIPYSFSGYYVDDAKIEKTQRGDDSVSVLVTFDGSQDLLLGKARITPKQEELIEESVAPDYMRSYSYSTYTARRNLFPVLDMKHALSRFRITLYPNDKNCVNIIVDSIKILTYNHVEMVAAHRDTSKIGCRFYGEKSLVSIKNTVNGSNRLLYESDGEIRPFHFEWKESYNSLAVYNRPGLECGNGLLIAPDSLYMLHTYTTQFHSESGEWAPHKYEDKLYLSGKQKFQAGGFYNIRISVGGFQQIAVQTTIIPWQTGESFEFTIIHDNE